MTIKWTCKITNVNVDTKRADISFVRDDSENADARESYTFQKAIIETPQQRVAILNQVWAKHQVHLAKQSAINIFINSLESSAEANLDGRE